MRNKRSLLLWAIVAVVIAGLGFVAFIPRTTHAANGDILTGTVKSASGEKLAGVTISAKIEGQTITTSVYTDEEGNYYFPAMAPGKYQVWAQADTFQTARADVEFDAVLPRAG